MFMFVLMFVLMLKFALAFGLVSVCIWTTFVPFIGGDVEEETSCTELLCDSLEELDTLKIEELFEVWTPF